MLICNKCKNIIDESDLSIHKDFMSFVGDKPYYEKNADNCNCGGEFEEAEECDCCDEYCSDNDITWGWRYNIKVCKGCIDYYKSKYLRAYNQLSINDTDEFIDWLVDINEIKEK